MQKYIVLIFLGLACAVQGQAQNGVLYNSSSVVTPNGLVMNNLTVNGLTNSDLTANALIATGANKRQTSVVIGSGLTYSGGTLAASGGGGGGSVPAGTMVSDQAGFTANYLPKASDSTGTNFSVSAVASGSTYPLQVFVSGVSKWKADTSGAVTQSGDLSLSSGNIQVPSGSVQGAYVLVDYYLRVGTSGNSVKVIPSGSEDGVATLQNNSSSSIGFLAQGRYNMPKTANYSVLYADSSALISNDGTSAQRTMTLPSATLNGAVGTTFTFAVLASAGVKIACSGTDQIRVGGSITAASTGFLDDTTIGDVITISCVKNGIWLATSVVGSGWTTH